MIGLLCTLLVFFIILGCLLSDRLCKALRQSTPLKKKIRRSRFYKTVSEQSVIDEDADKNLNKDQIEDIDADEDYKNKDKDKNKNKKLVKFRSNRPIGGCCGRWIEKEECIDIYEHDDNICHDGKCACNCWVNIKWLCMFFCSWPRPRFGNRC